MGEKKARSPNLLLVAAIAASQLPFPVKAHGDKIENVIKGLSFRPEERRIAENGTEPCGLCVDFGGTLVGGKYPEYDIDELEQGLNCSTLSEMFSFIEKSDRACYDVNAFFHGDCCQFVNSTTECEQDVHETVNGDDYNFDVEPLRVNEERLTVGVGISYFALTNVDTKEGTAELFLGIELTWRDDRLAWDPKDHGGCYYTNFRASIDPELTNIWVPPFDITNRVSSLQDLPEAYATANSLGEVFWFRFGAVKALCFFDGLERFPYDELTCDFDFGNTLFFSRLDYELTTNLTFPEEEDPEAVRKYQEFSVLTEKSDIELGDGYISCHFVFKRSSRYYNNTIVIPTILFTILSFGVFLLDQRVGERLGFGVSILLVIVAQAILTSDILPVTEERLWVNTLTQGSQYFAIAAVMESIFVAYLHYIKIEPPEEDDGKRSKPPNNSSSDAFDDNIGESVSFLNESNGEPNISESNTNPDNSLDHVETSNEETEEVKPNSEAKPSFVSKVRNFHWTASSIRKLDLVCLCLLPSSYIIFIIILFATNSKWGQN